MEPCTTYQNTHHQSTVVIGSQRGKTCWPFMFKLMSNINNVLFIHTFVVQAEISEGVTDMLENETHSVTFTCKPPGDPVPIISWYFKGAMINISDTSKYNVFSSINALTITSLLTIMNLQSSDAGIYVCEAENFIGSDLSFGILTVNGKYLSMS